MFRNDVTGIQELYGKPPPSTVIKTPYSSSGGQGVEDDGTICSKLDAIFATADGTTYVFRGSQYWRLTDSGVAGGYPRRISQDWPGLPDNIQAF